MKLEEKYPDAVVLPMEQYRLPIYKAWDEQKRPCPRHPNGWVAFHYQLLKEKSNVS